MAITLQNFAEEEVPKLERRIKEMRDLRDREESGGLGVAATENIIDGLETLLYKYKGFSTLNAEKGK
jgi:hypothetical protein